MEPQDPTHPFSAPRSPTASPQQPPPSSLTGEQEPRRRTGRPLRLTREVHDAIVSAVETGAYIKVAAQAAGVGASTLAAWLARGREAASLQDRHNEEHLHCPGCDLDRTFDALDVDAQNEDADTEHAAAVEEWQQRPDDDADNPTPEPEHPGHAVLAPCPRCHSDEQPAAWELPADEAPFLELLESVTLAQASAEVAAVAAWRSAFRDDWRAARDYLARTAPERWAGVTRVQMTTEEAERRIDDAVNEALLSVGIDALGREGDLLDDAIDEGLVP
jgi:hypothetical protein